MDEFDCTDRERAERDIAAIIAGRVREMLEACPLTLGEVARTIGVSSSCLSNWKAGRREIPSAKLVLLAAVCGRPIAKVVPDLRGFPATASAAGAGCSAAP